MESEAARRAKDQRRREDLLAGLRLETRLRRANPPPPARAEEERRRRYERIAGILRKVDEGSPDVGYVDEGTAGLLRRELGRLERGGANVVPIDAGEPVTPLFAVERSNTILYCQQWLPTVRFYRDELGLPVVADNEWYVEFRITGLSSVSVVDAARSTVGDTAGEGITLSWLVADLPAVRERLVERGLEPSEIRTAWNTGTFYLTDPEGHRIEVWSEHDLDGTAL